MAVGDVILTALLDTGSTHNFIAETAATRTGLQVFSDPRLTATVANGERISCPGVLRQAPIVIDGEEFCVDLYVLPLAGYDLVLGTQWLVTLGRIEWDFTARTLSFTRQDRRVCWSDVATPTPPLSATVLAPDDPPGRAPARLWEPLRRASRTAPAACPRPQHRPQAGRAAGGCPAVPVPRCAQR